MESLGMVQEAKVVVALDFGTTFSGFAYALRNDPGNVYIFYEWPNQAEGGGLPYCKTQTSLLYAATSDGSVDPYELCAWGWSACVEYCMSMTSSVALESVIRASGSKNSSIPQNMDVLSLSGGVQRHPASKPEGHSLSSDVGHFLTLFKLHLATKSSNSIDHLESKASAPALPPGMTARRVITDFLSQISKFILQEVRNKFGPHISLDDVQWCLTVPAIWDEQAKREMRDCTELAGLVQGPLSKDQAGSPHPVKLFIEPEAASVYCQLKLQDRTWSKGDKFLVVDCGGGTVDLVLHEKLGATPTLSVREVQESSGDLCGGSQVDDEFFRFMRRKIHCFQRFEREHPAIVLAFRLEWEKIKYEFDGKFSCSDVSLELPPKLATLWEEDEAIGRATSTSSFESYDELILTPQDMRSIFDPVVNRILKLIQARMLADLQAIMVVGGFSASPYLMSRIRETFGSRVAAIVSPPCPGSAVCCGAVTMEILSDIVVSRIAKKTYGVDVCKPFIGEVHPKEFKICDDRGNAHCNNIFDIFVRKGDEVRFDEFVKHTARPLNTNQKEVKITLYASEKRNPRYVIGGSKSKEEGAKSKKGGAVTINFPSYRELGFWPEVEVSMFFGRTEIQVTVIGKNFNSEKKEMLPVKFERDPIY